MIYMDSYNKYLQLKTNYANTTSNDGKIENYLTLIEIIYHEISDDHCVSKSPFLYTVVNTDYSLSKYSNCNTAPINVIDAFMVTWGVSNYFIDNIQSMLHDDEFTSMLSYLFIKCRIGTDTQLKLNFYLERVIKDLTRICKVSKYVQDSSISAGEQRKDSYSEQCLRIENEITTRTKQRTEAKKELVNKWHENQLSLIESTHLLQTGITEIYNKLVNQSDEILNSCIIKFADSLIEIYNCIDYSLKFHEDQAKETENPDYYAAVANYKEYMELLSDAMATFGIEEIISPNNTAFNPQIHEVIDTNSFSIRNTTIKKSVRSGFKYKEIIFQKEKVNLVDNI